MGCAEVALWKMTLIHHIECLIALVNRCCGVETGEGGEHPTAGDRWSCQQTGGVNDTLRSPYELPDGEKKAEDRHRRYKRLHKTHVLPLYARLVHIYTACAIMFIA